MTGDQESRGAGGGGKEGTWETKETGKSVTERSWSSAHPIYSFNDPSKGKVVPRVLGVVAGGYREHCGEKRRRNSQILCSLEAGTLQLPESIYCKETCHPNSWMPLRVFTWGNLSTRLVAFSTWDCVANNLTLLLTEVWPLPSAPET